MPPVGDRILPHTQVLLRLPSGVQKIVRISPDTTVSLGKFGSFPANALLHRPYGLTYDILETGLRVVPPEEITRDILGGGIAAANESHYDLPYTPGAASGSESEEVMKTNQNTVDDATSQTLTWQEIEELKKSASNGGRDLIQKLLESHTALDQKTPFSLQKYTLRKTSKFLRRFTASKVTVPALLDYLPTVKEPYRFLELRNCHVALMMSLANVVHGGRYLVVDETGGLLVAAIAERLGLLDYTPPATPDTPPAEDDDAADDTTTPADPTPPPHIPLRNTITLIHANEQPNLSQLAHFSYSPTNPPRTHPLATHLHTVSWLQLLEPSSDTTLTPPPPVDTSTLKPGKRAAHNRKQRRWARLHATVTSARAGGYDAVLVAAHMALPGVLRALVPLVRGSGQVVVYAPALQQVAELADLYSSARRAAWMVRRAGGGGVELPREGDWEDQRPDPTLVVAPTVHRVGVRRYQVLPGRTHPVMTSRGGAEGYVLHATRVLPVAGRVDARGAFAGRKRKGGEAGEGAEGKKVKTAVETEA